MALSPRTRYRRQLVNALRNAGQPDRALEVLREVVQVRPGDAGGWYSLSNLELELENYDEAQAAAQRLIEIEPDGLRGATCCPACSARSGNIRAW